MGTFNLGTLSGLETNSFTSSDSLTESDPTDVFRFSLNGTKDIGIALTNISAGDDADLRIFRDSNLNGIFDSPDQEIASSLNFNNSDEIINLADQGSGLYFAEVERFDPGSFGDVSYNLSLSATVNLGTLTNTPVTRNNFSVSADDPQDVFEFRLNQTSNINIAVTDITAGDDADLTLFRDSNFNGVFDSADQEIASSFRGGNNDDSINLADQVTGLYFAQVERFAPDSSGSVSYDIALSTSDPSNILHTEEDFGNLSADRSRSGFVGNTDTTDTYEFSIGLFEGVDISLTGLSSDADLRVIQDSNNNGLVDSTDEVIGTSTRGGSLSESISDIDLSGDYFVQVYQFSGDTSYTLNLDYFTTPFA